MSAHENGGIDRPMAHSKPTDLRPLPNSTGGNTDVLGKDLTQNALHNCIRQNARLSAALDYILTAYYYKPDQLDAEIQGARELIEDMGPEKPECAREVPRGVKR